MEITAIGVYRTSQKYKYDAGKQNDDFSAEGVIELSSSLGLHQALIGLEKFSHIWVLFQFHHNQKWKPMTLPPRGTQQKVGVLATRSPYRPNFIGMSAVKLQRIEGLKIFIDSSDLLDETPIFDIKPYLTFADSIPEANLGWIQDEKFQIQLSEKAQQQIEFLKKDGLTQLESFIFHQLEYQPFDSRRKRVQQITESEFILSYRTWRIRFQVNELQILISEIFSGYSQVELQDDKDPYLDKALHRTFLKKQNLS